MPGKWIRKDPDNGQVWNEYTEDEMSAAIRRGNPDSPDYMPHPTGASRLFRIDDLTVGVEIIGQGVDSVPFRFEFDLYEGWEPGRKAPAARVVAAATRAGMSLGDFLAASGATTAFYYRAIEADRAAHVRSADALLHALRAIADVTDPGITRDAKLFYREDNTKSPVEGVTPSAFGLTKRALLAVLGKLAGGRMDRAASVYHECQERGRTVAHLIAAFEQRWYEEDHAHRATSAA